MHSKISGVFVVSESAPLVVLKLMGFNHELPVRFLPLIGVNMDQLCVAGRYQHETAFIVASIIGISFVRSRMIQILIFFGVVIVLRLSLMGSLPVLTLARLKREIIVKASHPIRDLVRMDIQLI